MTDIATEQPQHLGAGHEHGWITESSHPTSEGLVVYTQCVRCGVRRVDLQDHPHLPPRSLTRALGEKGSTVRPTTAAAWASRPRSGNRRR